MIQLYTYYRSTAAYRVRIALQYKGIEHELIPINLLKHEHVGESYLEINPQGRVPTLVDNTQNEKLILTQSIAILEYLEEKYPENPLLFSKDKFIQNAHVRQFCQIIACDVHPLNNVAVLNYLKGPLKHSLSETQAWYHHWLKKGFDALLPLVSPTGLFCFGETLTWADLCLIPQIYNALRFEFSMDAYPRLLEIYTHCLSLPCFQKASPEKQLDSVFNT